jgi:hypothetical protein
MDSSIRRDYRAQLERIIASGGARKKKRKTRKSGMGEYDGDGLRAYGLRAGMRAGKKKAAKKKTTNPWIKHVKAYAKSHGLTYNEALKSPGVKRGYKKTGSGMRAGVRRTSSKMPKMTKKMMNMMMMEMMRKKKA